MIRLLSEDLVTRVTIIHSKIELIVEVIYILIIGQLPGRHVWLSTEVVSHHSATTILLVLFLKMGIEEIIVLTA